MINLAILLVLGVASYRLTRFLIVDSIIEGFRGKFHTFLANRTGKLSFLAEKVTELTSCTFCAGVYVSTILYSIYVLQYPWDLGRVGWINVLAVAGIQSLLHVIEPEDD